MSCHLPILRGSLRRLVSQASYRIELGVVVVLPDGESVSGDHHRTKVCTDSIVVLQTSLLALACGDLTSFRAANVRSNLRPKSSPQRQTNAGMAPSEPPCVLPRLLSIYLVLAKRPPLLPMWQW